MCDKKVIEWVKLALKNEDIIEYTVDVHGNSKKGDGYLSNIAFVTVTGKNGITGAKQTLNFVVKSSKGSDILRKQAPIKEAFEKEIYIYNNVKTAFDIFQKEKGIENLLDFIPYCYGTWKTEGNELLIFENLISKGCTVWDKKIPMTYNHIKLVLEAYGKWHAFSLALKNEYAEEFATLTTNNTNMFSYFILKVGMLDIIYSDFVKARNTVFSDEDTFLKKLQFSRDDAKYILSDMFFEDSLHQVILHGDCWNNNFMFKSQNDIKEPQNVLVLDWQCSGLGSPIIDLSHYIYNCCDTGKYQDVKDLLRIYYNSLSETLTLLGCDYNKVFSYDNLVKHWKQFSRYGLILNAFLLKFSLCDSEDAPDFAEAAEQGKEFIESLNFKAKNEELYHTRVKNNFMHYVKNLD